MIRRQKTLFYFVGDKPFASLAEAQTMDLLAMLPSQTVTGAVIGDNLREWFVEWLLVNCEAVVDTLTTTPRSRLRGRKLHGAVRHKKTKEQPASPV
jgi:hypothetical protein